MNQQLTETEYYQKIAEFKNLSYTQQQQLIQQWRNIISTQAIHQATVQVNVTDSTGNYLAKCHNVQEGYYVSNAENCSYIFQAEDIKDCIDGGNVAPAEFCYELTGVVRCQHCAFLNYSYDNTFAFYCDHVFNSQHMFACVGLNRQQYCILNKQYTESEYTRLRERVVQHMKQTGEYGEFFPYGYSPFSYNETVAHDLFPLHKAQALALGARWNDSLDQIPNVAAAVPADTLPERIAEITDDILKQTIICSVSRRPYRIQAGELAIYRRLDLPLPRKHPEVRFQERIQHRAAPRLYQRHCTSCQRPVQSSFAPGRPERIFCSTCYQAEIY
jgi:hypothetical protein